jgi:hypothetical protein
LSGLVCIQLADTPVYRHAPRLDLSQLSCVPRPGRRHSIGVEAIRGGEECGKTGIPGFQRGLRTADLR